jgi:hypothetical protein
MDMKRVLSIRSTALAAVMAATLLSSTAQHNTNTNLFRELTEELPTPNGYRTAAGRPGPDYFQQQADYVIEIVLDEKDKRVSGFETITYHNNSTEALSYLWMQLDQNILEQESFGDKISPSSMNASEPVSKLMRIHDDFDGGFKIEAVKDTRGNDMQTFRNHTIMKVMLSEPVAPGKTTRFTVKWSYNLNNLKKNWARSGYDPMAKNDDNVFAIAQFYPRLCVFNDRGWQIKQFIGAEFALEFGNFDVTITVPADHIVAATGELQNQKEVLSAEMIERLEKARSSDIPLFIVTPEEAIMNEEEMSPIQKKWRFKAGNVRDFAFASSRKFIWDAMNVPFGKNNVLAMSFYLNESEPLWSKYSTKTIAHTLRVYSEYTFDYPYPTAQSVDASLGMEYPMIGFNGGRPDSEGNYTKGTRDAVIGVIRHETGHNYIPMIVNTDERQWAWMDEGFNIFLQGIGERKWDIDQYWSGIPTEMIGYMDGDKKNIVPLMTDADALLQSGMNSYRKPAVGLTILRETILGRELFDQAFREYTTTWMFKHPQPADFFRIMEDASGVDLDWFWRGWFFTTEHVDISLDDVKLFIPVFNEATAREAAMYLKSEKREHIATIRDRGKIVNEIVIDKELLDKYNAPEPVVSEARLRSMGVLESKLSEEEKSLLSKGGFYYQIKFRAYGGMIMPLILEFEYTDGTKEEVRIPAEVWLKNQKEVTKVFIVEKEISSIVLDPHIETADVNTSNNYWPRRTERVYFEILK